MKMHTPTTVMEDLLKGIGCRRRENKFILDEFDTNFYLIFDVEECSEAPETNGTCDILIAHVGSYPKDSATQIRIVLNCNENKVVRFLLALGVNRFNQSTQKYLNEYFCSE